MVSLQQLSATDALFIAAETDSVYNHTGGLVLLDGDGQGALSFDDFRQYIIERVSQIPHFRWKLYATPLGLDLPYWVEDENFNYDHHIKRIAIPSPGDNKALAEVASYIYSRHLDHRRPLWEIWLIEGLAGGRLALLQKLHHCVMDGQGATKLAEIILDHGANASSPRLNQAMAQARPGKVPSQWEQSVRAALSYARIPGAATSTSVDIIRSRLGALLSGKQRKQKQKPPLAIAAFNREISRDRGFVFGSLPFKGIKAISVQFEVSVNDVVLALVGGAMRRYLLDQEQLPTAALRAMMAVSLRSAEDEDFSNRVTNVPVTLATDLADPLRRLQAIHRESTDAKRSARTGASGAMEIFELMPPVLISSINSLVNAEQTVQMLGANLVVSNLHGSDDPLYIAGTKIKATFPLSVLSNGISINFTCLSYNGQMDFGVILDPELFPEPWSIISGLEQTLSDYLQAARVAAGGKKKAPKRKRAAAKKAKSGSKPIARGKRKK